MNVLRSFAFLAIAIVLSSIDGLAHATAAFAKEASGKPWSFSASAYTYFVPDSRNYVQPTVTADRQWLHLEARYNYEDLDTGSAWVGYNFSVGEKLSLDFTPMLGGVFGNTTGIAPGYRGTLSWWKLVLYSEGEYVKELVWRGTALGTIYTDAASGDLKHAVEGILSNFPPKQ
jgi:hypothetical protein